LIAGGESGSGARPMEEVWARSLVEQCQDAKVPVFVKQMGSVWAKNFTVDAQGDRKGGDWRFWPADLRVREFPTAREEVSAR
jgi:protein gp37